MLTEKRNENFTPTHTMLPKLTLSSNLSLNVHSSNTINGNISITFSMASVVSSPSSL